MSTSAAEPNAARSFLRRLLIGTLRGRPARGITKSYRDMARLPNAAHPLYAPVPGPAGNIPARAKLRLCPVNRRNARRQ
jgi:hypothetical protein